MMSQLLNVRLRLRRIPAEIITMVDVMSRVTMTENSIFAIGAGTDVILLVNGIWGITAKRILVRNDSPTLQFYLSNLHLHLNL